MQAFTHNKQNFCHALLNTIILSVLSLLFLYSFLFNVFNIKDITDVCLTLMVLCFAVSIWYSFYISLRSLCTIIFVDEKGMGLKRFNKIILYLKYADIKEIGYGKAIFLREEKIKLYFATRILNAEEKNDLDLVQNEVIYFTDLSEEWKAYIENFSKLKLPEESQ